MKFPTIIAAVAFLTACSQPAKQTVETSTKSLEKATATSISASVPSSTNATCKHGTLDEDRSFILCEDGTLRKAGVLMALSAPHDPDLKIEGVAARYGIPSQVFTGIQSANFSTLTSKEGKPVRQGKHKPREGLVQIEGKIYDVYKVSIDDQTGTVFVERGNAEQ
jgi:hypothetical protein